MSAQPTITEFLLARIAERHAAAQRADWAMQGRWYTDADDEVDEFVRRMSPASVIAECEAMRRIVELHQTWPVLVQTEPLIERADIDDPDKFAYRAVQRLQWMTQQEYRTKFGDEPPTAPIIAELAAIDADHPDYRDEWRPA